MMIEQNKRIALQFIEGLGTNSNTDVFDLLDEDLVWTVMADRTSFALGGDMSKDQFVAHFGRFRQAIPQGMNIVVTGVTAEGGRVAVEVESNAAMVNGSKLSQLYHFLIEIKNERITRVKEYMDTAHAVEILKGNNENIG